MQYAALSHPERRCVAARREFSSGLVRGIDITPRARPAPPDTPFPPSASSPPGNGRFLIGGKIFGYRDLDLQATKNFTIHGTLGRLRAHRPDQRLQKAGASLCIAARGRDPLPRWIPACWHDEQAGTRTSRRIAARTDGLAGQPRHLPPTRHKIRIRMTLAARTFRRRSCMRVLRAHGRIQVPGNEHASIDVSATKQASPKGRVRKVACPSEVIRA